MVYQSFDKAKIEENDLCDISVKTLYFRQTKRPRIICGAVQKEPSCFLKNKRALEEWTTLCPAISEAMWLYTTATTEEGMTHGLWSFAPKSEIHIYMGLLWNLRDIPVMQWLL